MKNINKKLTWRRSSMKRAAQDSVRGQFRFEALMHFHNLSISMEQWGGFRAVDRERIMKENERHQ